MDFAVLVDGYRQTVGRFHEARTGRDARAAYFPLFEALNWAAAADEYLKHPHHGHLRGLRYARHCVHHQWADALWLDESGGAFPVTFPRTFFEWRWRDELPPARNQTDEPAYREYLATHPARLTLDSVLEYLVQRLPS